MSAKEAYKQKIEADVELAHAKLAELKARAKISKAEARIKYARHIEELEQKVIDMKVKLKELGDAGEDAWEHLKSGVESAYDALNTAVRNTTAWFKG